MIFYDRLVLERKSRARAKQKNLFTPERIIVTDYMAIYRQCQLASFCASRSFFSQFAVVKYNWFSNETTRIIITCLPVFYLPATDSPKFSQNLQSRNILLWARGSKYVAGIFDMLFAEGSYSEV
jgi:hypothetical protein